MHRRQILETAIDITHGSRNAEYGEPDENLANIAGLWSAYLHGKFRGQVVDEFQLNLAAEDVAWLNVLQKIARTFGPTPKADTYIDAAAYAAIAGQCALGKDNLE